MEINSGFKILDEEEERVKLLKTLMTDDTYRFIACLYEEKVREYIGGFYQYLPRKNTGTKKYRKRIEQIQKFIIIAVNLGVPFDVYLRAQFEQQMPFFSTFMRYVPFVNLTTEKAIQHFETWRQRVHESYISSKQRREAFFKGPYASLEKEVKGSILSFYKRLETVVQTEGYGVLDRNFAIEELEGLSRRGTVADIYVASIPLDLKDSVFLMKIAKRVKDRISKDEKKAICQIRERTIGKLLDKRIVAYV